MLKKIANNPTKENVWDFVRDPKIHSILTSQIRKYSRHLREGSFKADFLAEMQIGVVETLLKRRLKFATENHVLAYFKIRARSYALKALKKSAPMGIRVTEGAIKSSEMSALYDIPVWDAVPQEEIDRRYISLGLYNNHYRTFIVMMDSPSRVTGSWEGGVTLDAPKTKKFLYELIVKSDVSVFFHRTTYLEYLKRIIIYRRKKTSYRCCPIGGVSDLSGNEIAYLLAKVGQLEIEKNKQEFLRDFWS